MNYSSYFKPIGKSNSMALKSKFVSNSPINSGNVGGASIVNTSSHYHTDDFPGSEDSEHEDYMMMTPKQTPSHPVVREAIQTKSNESLYRSKADIDKTRFEYNTVTNIFEESDYADMSGAKSSSKESHSSPHSSSALALYNKGSPNFSGSVTRQNTSNFSQTPSRAYSANASPIASNSLSSLKYLSNANNFHSLPMFSSNLQTTVFQEASYRQDYKEDYHDFNFNKQHSKSLSSRVESAPDFCFGSSPRHHLSEKQAISRRIRSESHKTERRPRADTAAIRSNTRNYFPSVFDESTSRQGTRKQYLHTSNQKQQSDSSLYLKKASSFSAAKEIKILEEPQIKNVMHSVSKIKQKFEKSPTMSIETSASPARLKKTHSYHSREGKLRQFQSVRQENDDENKTKKTKQKTRRISDEDLSTQVKNLHLQEANHKSTDGVKVRGTNLSEPLRSSSTLSERKSVSSAKSSKANNSGRAPSKSEVLKQDSKQDSKTNAQPESFQQTKKKRKGFWKLTIRSAKFRQAYNINSKTSQKSDQSKPESKSLKNRGWLFNFRRKNKQKYSLKSDIAFAIRESPSNKRESIIDATVPSTLKQSPNFTLRNEFLTAVYEVPEDAFGTDYIHVRANISSKPMKSTFERSSFGQSDFKRPSKKQDELIQNSSGRFQDKHLDANFTDEVKIQEKPKQKIKPNAKQRSKTLGRQYYKNQNNRSGISPPPPLIIFDCDQVSSWDFHVLPSTNQENFYIQKNKESKKYLSLSPTKQYFSAHGFAMPSPSPTSSSEKNYFDFNINFRERKRGLRKKYKTLKKNKFFKNIFETCSSDLDDGSLCCVKRDDFDDGMLFPNWTIEEAQNWRKLEELVCSKRPSILHSETKPVVHPLYPTPSAKVLEISRLLLDCIKASQPGIIVGYEEIHEEMHAHLLGSTDNNRPEIDEILRWSYAKGNDLVTWTDELLKAKQHFDKVEDEFFEATTPLSREEIVGLWQILFEEGAIFHVMCEEHFEDGDFYYGFHEEVTSPKPPRSKLSETAANNAKNDSYKQGSEKTSEVMMKLMPLWVEKLDLADSISYLRKHRHDALFRKALQRPPTKRTGAELALIYHEIIHIKPIAHLSDSVKRELARVVKYEFHHDPDSFVFKQGDEGTSWYIILHGSVKVEILGKGIVCTLGEGDDFGNLSLVNDAPRSASIIVAEPNCHFIKVDKIDFNRILKDVEANTVRLKEHGEDVLILEKIRSPSRKLSDRYSSSSDNELNSEQNSQTYRYSITAGTPEAIVEHILEYMQPWKINAYDETLEEFILMHRTFMDTKNLLDILLKNYCSEDPLSAPFDKSIKRKVIYFVIRWSHIMTYALDDQKAVKDFFKELEKEIKFDSEENSDYKPLIKELSKVYRFENSNKSSDIPGAYIVVEETVKRYHSGTGQQDPQRPILDSDEVLLKIYSCDKVYTTVKVPISSNASQILTAVAEKTNSRSKSMKLLEVHENGDTFVIPDERQSAITRISLNSILSICEHNDKRTQTIRPAISLSNSHFESANTIEMAFHITQYDRSLFNNVHVMEYIYKVFGPKKFRRPTPNLDILSRRFNQLAYWPPTEICTCANINKRAVILRKFIKIAQHLKAQQNMNAFMALMIGIDNQAVTRLSGTWEKLPAKYRKLVQDFESILDPSRNHRNYRLLTSSMEPPFLPYLPLLLKDMLFQHEGNKDRKQGLVNFEKMRMISNSIKTIIHGCSESIKNNAGTVSSKTANETKFFVMNVKVITDQKKLNDLSAQIEPKR